MGGEKGREMTEWSGGGAEGVIIYIYIYIYYLPWLKGDLPPENSISICISISKYVFKFSACLFL